MNDYDYQLRYELCPDCGYYNQKCQCPSLEEQAYPMNKILRAGIYWRMNIDLTSGYIWGNSMGFLFHVQVNLAKKKVVAIREIKP